MDLVTTDVSASTYTARWTARGERIVFELAGRGQGWVGIGFSYNQIMVIVLSYYFYKFNIVYLIRLNLILFLEQLMKQATS